MCDKTSTLQVLVLVVAALIGIMPACDSNPTPHPGQDASGGKETAVSGEPNEGYVDGPGDDTDRDPAASVDGGETGGFTGQDGDVVGGDAAPVDGATDGGAAEEDDDAGGGEVAPSHDNAAACPGEAADPDDDGRLEE